MRVKTLVCASVIRSNVAQEPMFAQAVVILAHAHGRVSVHINCHLAHVCTCKCALLEGTYAFGLGSQAKGIVHVRMCTCLFHMQGIIYMHAVVRGLKMAIYDTHSESKAYHCDIQPDCDALF